MCKVGDIILVEEYQDINGYSVGKHPFVVVHANDEIAVIEIDNIKYEYDHIAVASTTSKPEENSIHGIPNIEVEQEHGVREKSYIKLDVIHYLDKREVKYHKLGTIDKKIIEEILEIINIDHKVNVNNTKKLK